MALANTVWGQTFPKAAIESVHNNDGAECEGFAVRKTVSKLSGR
jgi:hypothetical protein